MSRSPITSISGNCLEHQEKQALAISLPVPAIRATNHLGPIGNEGARSSVAFGIVHPASGDSGAPASSETDNSELSPLAHLIGTLEHLQLGDPVKYGQVTEQMAANIYSVAETAESQGNSIAASQIAHLAKDFSMACRRGLLADLLQDLAEAAGASGPYHGSPQKP